MFTTMVKRELQRANFKEQGLRLADTGTQENPFARNSSVFLKDLG